MKTLRVYYRFGWSCDSGIEVTIAGSDDDMRLRNDRGMSHESTINIPPDATTLDIWELCNVDVLRECHLLIFAIRKYAAICSFLGLAPEVDDWTTYELEDLDPTGMDDYRDLCNTLALILPPAHVAEQRAKLDVST